MSGIKRPGAVSRPDAFSRDLWYGSLNLATNVGIFKDARLVTGMVRYGIATPIDVTGSVAVMDHTSANSAVFILGGDIQYRFTHTDLGDPLDMAVSGLIEYYKLDVIDASGVSHLGFGGSFVASRPVKLENGFNFTPYGRLNLRVDRSHADYAIGHESKFPYCLQSGLGVSLGGKVSLIGELQIAEQVGFLAGINFFMW